MTADDNNKMESNNRLSYDQLMVLLKEREEELREFQESSRELEEELEQQLKQSENKIKELTSSNARILMENDRLTERISSVTKELTDKIDTLSDQLNRLSIERESLIERVRQLEQDNDDLERGNRALDSTLQDFQKKFDDLIEQKVFLENELGEKEGMEVTIQRLRDEARDLRQELIISQQHQQQQGLSLSGNNIVMNGVSDGHHNQESSEESGRETSNGTTATSNGNGSQVLEEEEGKTRREEERKTRSIRDKTPTRGGIPLPKHRLVSFGNKNSSPSPSSQAVPVVNKSLTNNNNDGQQQHHHFLPHQSQSFDSNSSQLFKVASSSMIKSPSRVRSTSLQYNNNNSSGIPPPGSSTEAATTTVLSPTTRSSALNIVSDLLRKVGALENKLASCRNPHNNSMTSSSSPSAKYFTSSSKSPTSGNSPSKTSTSVKGSSPEAEGEERSVSYAQLLKMYREKEDELNRVKNSLHQKQEPLSVITSSPSPSLPVGSTTTTRSNHVFMNRNLFLERKSREGNQENLVEETNNK